MRWLAFTYALLILVGAPRTARAHQTGVTHVSITVDGDDARVSVLIAPADIAEPVGLLVDPPPSADAIRSVTGDIVAYVSRGIDVRDDDVRCPLGDATVDMVENDGAFVHVNLLARCPRPIRRLVVDYDLFFDIDETHEAVLRVDAGGDHADTVLRAGEARFVWDLGGGAPSGTLAFVRSGIEHILHGFDHIAFVLTLLVAIVLTRGSPPPSAARRSPYRRRPAFLAGQADRDGRSADRLAGHWRRRRFLEALRATALIVTSFTVAHSITLIAASLGFVSIPAQIVESAIAISIVYTAVENVLRPDVPWRFVLTFAFGLIHGLGFARVLAVMLPPDDVIVPLLTFNVGVELGQLAIVAVALPAWWLLCGAVGAERYRRVAMPALSAILAVLGLLWLAERIFAITILGF